MELFFSLLAVVVSEGFFLVVESVFCCFLLIDEELLLFLVWLVPNKSSSSLSSSPNINGLFLTADNDGASFGLSAGFFTAAEDFEGLDLGGPPNRSSSDPSLSGLPPNKADEVGFFCADVAFPGLNEVGLGGPWVLVLGGSNAPPPPNKSSSTPAGGLPNSEDDKDALLLFLDPVAIVFFFEDDDVVDDAPNRSSSSSSLTSFFCCFGVVAFWVDVAGFGIVYYKMLLKTEHIDLFDKFATILLKIRQHYFLKIK